MVRQLWTHLFILLLLSPLLIASSGCNSQQIEEIKSKLTATKDKVVDLQVSVDTAIAEQAKLQSAIVKMPDGSEKDRAIALAAGFADVIEIGQKSLGLAENALIELQGRLAHAQDAWDVADAGVKTAAPFIPPPYGTALLGIWGAVMTLRARHNRKAGKEAIASVSPFLDMNDQAKNTVRSRQGPAAKRLVDEAQGKKFAFPI